MPEKTVIAVPRESAPGETRVALTPDTVRRLVSDALAVRVEQGAGALAAFPDEAYSEAGADIVAGPEGLAEADIWVRVQPPREREDGTDEVEMIRSGGVLASFLSPAESPDLLRRLAERQVTALSIELLPRITRAQRMDALRVEDAAARPLPDLSNQILRGDAPALQRPESFYYDSERDNRTGQDG
ncbi:MAG: hypothetical protein P8Y10_10050 [Gemmatimonadales bacterium]